MSRRTPPGERPAAHVAVRLEADVIARIDALMEPLSTEWLRLSRSDALRAIIMRGLPLVEADVRAAKKSAERKAKRSQKK